MLCSNTLEDIVSQAVHEASHLPCIQDSAPAFVIMVRISASKQSVDVCAVKVCRTRIAIREHSHQVPCCMTSVIWIWQSILFEAVVAFEKAEVKLRPEQCSAVLGNCASRISEDMKSVDFMANIASQKGVDET
jgi:hypothetical protein